MEGVSSFAVEVELGPDALSLSKIRLISVHIQDGDCKRFRVRVVHVDVGLSSLCEFAPETSSEELRLRAYDCFVDFEEMTSAGDSKIRVAA